MMSTCKECLHHGVCEDRDKLMLAVNNIFELMYQHGVEHSCVHFKSTADVVPKGECDKWKQLFYDAKKTIGENAKRGLQVTLEEIEKSKAEVVDEFAKRLKEKMNDLSRLEYDCVPYFIVSKSFIDKIAEEMKGK